MIGAGLVGASLVGAWLTLRRAETVSTGWAATSDGSAASVNESARAGSFGADSAGVIPIVEATPAPVDASARASNGAAEQRAALPGRLPTLRSQPTVRRTPDPPACPATRTYDPFTGLCVTKR